MTLAVRRGLATGALAGACVLGLISGGSAVAQPSIQLNKIGGYTSGIYAQGAAEIVAHDPATQRLFVVNAHAADVDVLDVGNPSSPTLLFSIDVTPYGAVANSVAVHDGIVAVAVENAVKQAPGKVVFFDTNGEFQSQVTVGALPDMLTFSPNGEWVLVANEGEPNSAYTVDPNGSVSIIAIEGDAADIEQSDVRTLDFTAYNNAQLDPSIRIFGPNATVAQDLEPEYITVSHNSKTAWVSLQEGNAMAIIDIKKGKVTSLVGLGFKNHNVEGNAIDASDRDNAINIAPWPVYGMYQPDALAAYHHRGETYIVSANEGDARDYAGFAEESRVRSITLDPTAFPNGATLRDNARLGRLTITTANGDIDRDGDFDRLYAFGARSFSIWSETGALVYDSGDDFERITAAAYPTGFNSDNAVNNSFDTRSDNKGPEPEGVAVGKVSGRTYAFIGLERIGGIIVYDITNPNAPGFVQYINTRNFNGDAVAGTAGDLGPEGLHFISEDESPNGNALLVYGNEVSGSTTILEINKVMPKPVAGEDIASGHASLHQNYPNPFSASTTISFSLNREGSVALKVIALDGREVATVAIGTYGAGSHEIQFDASRLSSGTYFYRLDLDGAVREMRQLTVTR